MSQTTAQFKNTRFYVTNKEEAEAVQKAMFALGFKWQHRTDRVDILVYTPGYIFVDKNCRMSYGIQSHYDHFDSPRANVSKSRLFAAVKTHKAEKRAAKKASRKRKQLRKQGWTVNTGVKPKGDVIAVITKAGKVFDNPAYADYNRLNFNLYGGDYTISAYKLAEPKVVVPAVSVQDMVADIVASAGGKEVKPTPQPDVFVEVPEIDTKPDTNPKKQYGVQSIPLNMWSPLASAYGALGLYNGSLKYGKANFANTPVEASIYIAAAFRHLSAWAAGQEFDPADGVPNLGGVLANVAILLEARSAGTLIDDRLKMDGYLKEIDALKEIVKSLNKLHEGKTPKHYTLGN